MANLRAVPYLAPRRPRVIDGGPPKKQKQAVSTSGIFKNRFAAARSEPGAPRNAKVAINRTEGHRSRSPRLAKAPYGRSSSASASKGTDAKAHPLSTDFNETTATYRQEVLTTYLDQLDKVYAGLLTEIKTMNGIAPAVSSPADIDATLVPDTDPLGKALEPLRTPLGDTPVPVQTRHPDGRITTEHIAFHERVEAFQKLIAEKELEVREQQKQWDTIANEIVLAGTQVLGEENTRNLMGERLGKDQTATATSKGEAESLPKRTPIRFKVRPSIAKKSLPRNPVMSAAQVKELETHVDELGLKAVEDYEKLEKERQKEWENKKKKLFDVLKGVDEAD